MAETDIAKLQTTDILNQLADYSVDQATPDGPTDSKETSWDNVNWQQQFGYYKTIPELTAAIDAKATWTVGRGYTSDPITTLLLMQIRGWGKDTFNTIIENMIRTYHIGGDAFAEIIVDDYGVLINLKPLDPGSIRIVANRQGRIIRYEQKDRIRQKSALKFAPEKIFHMARNRIADEIHGTSAIDAVENIILMRNEAMDDQKKILHRNVPHVIWHVDTDDTAKINEFKDKIDQQVKDRENIIIPKGTVEREVGAIASNATLSPIPWIQVLTGYFYQAIGVPDIILGSSTNLTEASAKIAYLAFEQTIREEQLYVKEQILAQLNLAIELEMPAKLENELLTGKQEQTEPSSPAIEPESPNQPNDTTAELEGRK